MLASSNGGRLSQRIITFNVPPEDIRTFRDPNGMERKWYMVQLPVDEVHRARMLFGPNPRNQNLETKVSQGIFTTLKEIPAWFLYYSKGIVINAERVEYNKESEELKVYLRVNDDDPWRSPDGNLDGGHIQKAIL